MISDAWIEQLFNRFLTTNWVKEGLKNPLVLISRTTYEVFIFQVLDNSVSVITGSTSATYSPPKTIVSSTGNTTVTTQYLTDTVAGKPRSRGYNISTEILFLRDITNYIQKSLGNLIGNSIKIFSSMDYVKEFETRVASAYGNTASDIFMMYSPDGTIFKNCIVQSLNIKVGFSAGVANTANGNITLQEIVPYDIESILTTNGTNVSTAGSK